MQQCRHSPGGKCSSSWCSANWESVKLYDTRLDISELVLAGSHHLHQGAKRNGDIGCYQQATHPPAGLCRMGRKSSCCSFQVISLRFSQFQCNLPGIPCMDPERMNEQSQPFWRPLKVMFSSRDYTGPDGLGWELVRRTSTEHILFLWPVEGWVRCGKTIFVGS